MVMMAAFVQAQEVAETTATENSTPLYRIGQTYYYGETPMDKKAYARFLQETCPVYSLGVIGTALELASIPTLCVGYAKMHNSVDTFNAACYSRMKTKAYWSVNASGNGIGLAYNF